MNQYLTEYIDITNYRTNINSFESKKNDTAIFWNRPQDIFVTVKNLVEGLPIDIEKLKSEVADFTELLLNSMKLDVDIDRK